MKKFGILLMFSVLPFVGMSFLPTAFAGLNDLICPYGQDPTTGQCFCGPANGITTTTIPIDDCVERPQLMVSGDMIPIDTTMVLVAGTQYTAAWMIPVIVAGIGIAIVIARKF